MHASHCLKDEWNKGFVYWKNCQKQLFRCWKDDGNLVKADWMVQIQGWSLQLCKDIDWVYEKMGLSGLKKQITSSNVLLEKWE